MGFAKGNRCGLAAEEGDRRPWPSRDAFRVIDAKQPRKQTSEIIVVALLSALPFPSTDSWSGDVPSLHPCCFACRDDVAAPRAAHFGGGGTWIFSRDDNS